jgi:tetratricopeptide (TPR) repeat protein
MQQDSRLAEAANRTWAIAGNIHDRQTAKGGNVNGRIHVEMVEDNIWRLLYETHDRSRKLNSDNFSAVDLYLLSCAACCHDFDKGLHNSVLPADFEHGEGSGDFVYRNWQALSIESEAAAEYIDSIVRIHDFKDDFDEKLQLIRGSYTLLNTTGDLWVLAVLLKAADTLHVDESRVCRLAAPDDSLQGFDRVKQVGRGSIHGWRPDGERIVITGSIKSRDVAEALLSCEKYIRTKEWPPVDRNLRSCGFPHKIDFEWHYPPSLQDQLIKEGVLSVEGLNIDFERIASGMLTAKSATPASLVSDEPLRLVAVPPDKLAEYLAAAGPLSVIDNSYIQPQLTELGVSPGAVNRIFVGPANCGKTRAAYEWICDRVGLDPHAWVVLRPESGSIPQDASKFIIDFERYYGPLRPHKAILFADDLPDYLPPPGTGPVASEAVHRLLEWFRQYPGFQERCFVGTIRSERMHDKPGWPDRLIELGQLRLLSVEPLDEVGRGNLWKGMSKGRTYRNENFRTLDVEIDEKFLDAVTPLNADPEAIAYYMRAMAERGKPRISQEDADSFNTDVAKIWIDLTWPTIFETYRAAACVFLTLARFVEAGARAASGFRGSLAPAWDYHAVFGPALLAENGGNRDDYLPSLKRMLEDGHASGINGEWVRPKFDFLLQAPRLENIELPLPASSWFARNAHGLSPSRETRIAFYLTCARHSCAVEAASSHWLLGEAFAMGFMGTKDRKNASSWYSQTVRICDELIRRFGSDDNPDVREQIAEALVWKGMSLQLQRMFGSAVEAYDELVSRFDNDIALTIRAQVVWGLVNKGIAHGRLGEYEQALATFDKLFGEDALPRERDVPAKQLNGLRGAGKDEEALEPCAELSKRFGDKMFALVKDYLAEALFYKGVALGSMDRFDEALAPFGLLANCFGDNASPLVRNRVATGLVLKGRLLARRGRHEEADEAFEELQLRFGQDDRPSVREQVATGLYYSTSNYIGMWHSSKDKRLLDKAISNGREAVRLGAGCYNLACALALDGQLNEAFELLKEALGKSEIPWSHVAQDTDWKALRDDPWYKGLEAKYGSKSHGTGEAPPQKS